MSAKKFIQTGKLTTTERNATGIAEDGRLWYNRTTNKFEGRENGLFVNLGLPIGGTTNQVMVRTAANGLAWANQSGRDGTDAGIPFMYRTTVALGSLGNGEIRIQNIANPSSVIFNRTDADGEDVGAFIDKWDDGSSYVRGRISLVAASGRSDGWAEFDVTSVISYGGSTARSSVVSRSFVTSSAQGTEPFADNTKVIAHYTRTGDTGVHGSGVQYRFLATTDTSSSVRHYW